MDRRATYDTYLPKWLARCNAQRVGALFVVGPVLTAIRRWW